MQWLYLHTAGTTVGILHTIGAIRTTIVGIQVGIGAGIHHTIGDIHTTTTITTTILTIVHIDLRIVHHTIIDLHMQVRVV